MQALLLGEMRLAVATARSSTMVDTVALAMSHAGDLSATLEVEDKDGAVRGRGAHTVAARIPADLDITREHVSR